MSTITTLKQKETGKPTIFKPAGLYDEVIKDLNQRTLDIKLSINIPVQ